MFYDNYILQHNFYLSYLSEFLSCNIFIPYKKPEYW